MTDNCHYTQGDAMHVLIAYDGSEHADAALVDLARAGLPDDTTATVMTVADIFDPPPMPPENLNLELAQVARHARVRVEEALGEARKIVERGTVRLRLQFPNWRISTTAVADSPGWAIIKHAEGKGEDQRPADLIVVGAAGHGAIGRTIFGSVALKVMTNARCAVRIGRGQLAIDPSSSPRILVAVDGSPDAMAAVRAAALRNWPQGTTARVITVNDLQLMSTFPAMGAAAIPPPHAPAQLIVDQAAEQLRKAGLSVTTIVREGGVTASIIAEADSFKADCIFIGARGLRRLERFLLGSVSSALAMRAHCSVEVVHVAT